MNSNPQITRVIQVSMGNIKAWIETGLRSVGELRESEDCKLTFTFHGKVNEWDKLPIIPLTIQYQEEGVDVIYIR